MTTTRKSDDVSSTTPRRLHTAGPYVAACLIVVALFAVLEAAHPYYFLQDDNRDIFLPLFVHNYRAASDGQLAQYNFYQSLGKPHFATGQAAALQPFNYLAVFCSVAAFGHVFATADILVLLYLLLGAIGVVYFLRSLGFSGASAVFVASAWCFSPFNMLTSQSWTTYAPVIGLLPWIAAGTVLVYRRARAGASIFTLAHLALFYVGAPQFFLYAVIIDAGLLALMAAGDWRAGTLRQRGPLKLVGTFALLSALVTALCMPLLLPMWNLMQESAFRGREMSSGELFACHISFVQLLNGLFLPFRQIYEPLGGQWCETFFPPSFTHQGYLATLLLIAYPFARKRAIAAQRRVLDACFLLGLLLILGALGGLTALVAQIPVANRFRWPFKYFGFANLLLLLCVAPCFDWVVRRSASTRARLVLATLLIAVQSLNLVALDRAFPRQGFFEHLDPVPLHEPFRPLLQASRTITIGCRGHAGQFEKLQTLSTLGYDYATLWQLHFFGGYDPLVPSRNFNLTFGLDYNSVLCTKPGSVPVDYLRHWAVGSYLLLQPTAAAHERVLLAQGFRRVAADRDRVLMRDPLAPPLAGSSACRMISIDRNGDDFLATVDCRTPSAVTLRFLFNSYFSATVDGRPVEVTQTPESLVMVPVDAGRHTIRLGYDDPWLDAGTSIAGLGLGAAMAFLFLTRNRRKSQQPN